MPEQQMSPRTPEVRVAGTEKGVDQARRTPERSLERSVQMREQTQTAPVPVTTPAAQLPDRSSARQVLKSESLQRIESVLEEGLVDFYVRLPADKQAEFKRVGEETANKIDQLVRSAKATAKKVFNLIRDWLKLIPGVNTYFLEQEAKIKTDTVLRGE